MKNVLIIKTVDGKYLRIDPDKSSYQVRGADGNVPRYFIEKCTIDGLEYEGVCIPFSSIIFYGYRKEA